MPSISQLRLLKYPSFYGHHLIYTKPFGSSAFSAQQADKFVARKISASYNPPVSGPVKTAKPILSWCLMYMIMAV